MVTVGLSLSKRNSSASSSMDEPLLRFDVFLRRGSPSKSRDSTGSPRSVSAGAMMGEPGVCNSSSMGKGSRGGRDMKDMLDTLPWLWRAVSLWSSGDNEVFPTGWRAVEPVEVALGFGTSTGLLGAASGVLSGVARTGACLDSKGLGAAAATPAPERVEPTGEAANEVMGRAEEFVMSVEPFA